MHANAAAAYLGRERRAHDAAREIRESDAARKVLVLFCMHVRIEEFERRRTKSKRASEYRKGEKGGKKKEKKHGRTSKRGRTSQETVVLWKEREEYLDGVVGKVVKERVDRKIAPQRVLRRRA